MIKTVTFNPALDVSGTVQKLVPNEKTYVEDEVHTPGGNGINAAVIASRLGATVTASGFLGGSNGEEIQHLLDKLKLKHDFIPIHGRTRMNLTVNNCDDHQQTRLSFPGPEIEAKERRALEEWLKGARRKDLVLFGGSLPPGFTPSHVKTLVRRLSKKGVCCFVDQPGEILREVVEARPYFIKPNLVEFQGLVGKKVEKIAAILPLIRKLNEKVPLICVSSVEGGAILVTKDEAWFGKLPKVTIRSTVGAGDSMVGAMAAKLNEDRKTPVKELLRWGLAAACATLTERGMALGSKRAMKTYYPKIIIKEIK